MCFNIFIPCTSLPGCAMELASRRLSNYGRGDLSLHTSGRRGWGFGFGVVRHFHTMYITPGSARGNPACRRLSTQVFGNFGLHTSGMEGWGLCFGVCQQFYTMYISPGLRGGNRLADGSLLMVTAILVRIQAKREGGGYVLVCFNIFIQCTFLPGCAGDTRLPTNLYSWLRRFWFAAERESRDFILLCFDILYHEFFSRAVRGKSACRRLSTCGCGNFDSYTSVTGGWGFCFGVCQQLNSPCTFLPGCAKGTFLLATLY